MRTFLLALVLTGIQVLPPPTQAATPPFLIDYQAVVNGPGGQPLNESSDFVFRLFDDPASGNEIAVDEHLASGTGAVPATMGLVNVKLGSGNFSDGSGPGVYDSLDIVVRDFSDLYLQVEINGEILLPRVQVTSTPFALNAAQLEGESLIDRQVDTDLRITNHGANASAHHPRFDNAEAVAAMGSLADGNPLNHARRPDSAIVSVIANSPLVPNSACSGSDQILRWDGSGWLCETIDSGQSNGNANGVEILDPWGDGWDSVQRPVLPWLEAKTQCESLGGRLPTATELFRNRAVPGGSGSLGDTSATSFLWSVIATATPGFRATLRLSDGDSSASNISAVSAYRCIFPSANSMVFDSSACHGPPGSECLAIGLAFNIDQLDRPALDFAAAVNECNFYHASLPEGRAFQEAVQQGLPNATNSFLWLGDEQTSNAPFAALARYDANPTFNFHYSSATGQGSFGNTSANFGFRCIGRRSANLGVLPVSPPCNGGCFITMDRAAPLFADTTDRSAATHGAAAADCGASGGALPHLDEFADLVHAGWTTFPDALWTSDVGRDQTLAIFDQGGLAAETWRPTIGTGSIQFAGTPTAYRCIWRPTLETTVTTCGADQIQVWDGSTFSCQAATNGSSAGNAMPIEFLDAWGNAWDLSDRAATNYMNAEDTCSGLGGSLPLPGEVHRVRNNNDLAVPSIGGPSDTSQLWTLSPHSTAGQRTTIRISDGETTGASVASATPYRCVWRSSQGSAFGSRDCHGDPADGCFQVNRRRSDQFDRATVTQPAAAFECAFLRGRLPNLDDFQALQQAGAPNGSGNFSWISDTQINTNGGIQGYAVARWTGTGAADYAFQGADAALSAGETSRPHRCMFSDEMR